MKTCTIVWYHIKGTVHFEAMVRYKGQVFGYYPTINEAKEKAISFGFTHYKLEDNFYNVSGRKVLSKRGTK